MPPRKPNGGAEDQLALAPSAEPEDRGNVIVMVARETMRLVGVGMLVGLLAAWAATRVIASALFGLTAMDPLTVVSAVFVMAAVALLSGYVPSRRAADVNPVEALRQE